MTHSVEYWCSIRVDAPHSGLPVAVVNFTTAFMLHSLIENRFAVEKLLSVCGGVRLLHYYVKSSHWCCCRFDFQSSHTKSSYCYVFLLSDSVHMPSKVIFFSFLPPTVTERANHARDHLITEAQLDKYDGWVPQLFYCHFRAYFLCQVLFRNFIIHEPKPLI